MTYSDENVQTLVDFGLSAAQAKTYLALLGLSTSTISEIARSSKIARPDTYRAISTLHERGLVEKVIGKPARYKPISIDNAIRVLVQQRKRESIEISNRASKLIRKFSKLARDSSAPEDNHLVLIPAGETLLLELQKRIDAAERNVYLLTTRRRLRQLILRNHQTFKNALDRNVTLHVVTEAQKSKESDEISTFAWSSLFRVSYVSSAPSVWMAIFDDQETIFVASTKLDYSKSSAILSNNAVVLEIVRSYFRCASKEAASFDKSDRELSEAECTL